MSPQRSHDHHRACAGGCGELADECRCAHPRPFGSMRLDNTGCPSCDRDLSYPGAPGHACYTYAELWRARRAGRKP